MSADLIFFGGGGGCLMSRCWFALEEHHVGCSPEGDGQLKYFKFI